MKPPFSVSKSNEQIYIVKEYSAMKIQKVWEKDGYVIRPAQKIIGKRRDKSGHAFSFRRITALAA